MDTHELQAVAGDYVGSHAASIIAAFDGVFLLGAFLIEREASAALVAYGSDLPPMVEEDADRGVYVRTEPNGRWAVELVSHRLADTE